MSLKLEASKTEHIKQITNKVVKTAAVVPAYNEEKRIQSVLKALVGTQEVSEIIVVSDGSTDMTYQKAQEIDGVKAIQLECNVGKGGAMRAGALHTDADVLVFFDADLIGLTSQHVADLISPVCTGEATMATGVLCGGRWATDFAQMVSPGITGQRAIRRDVFLSIPDLDRVGYGIELAINYHVQYNGYTRKVVRLQGVTHPMKEEKLGWFRGIASRSVMYWQMLKFRISYDMRHRAGKK